MASSWPCSFSRQYRRRWRGSCFVHAYFRFIIILDLIEDEKKKKTGDEMLYYFPPCCLHATSRPSTDDMKANIISWFSDMPHNYTISIQKGGPYYCVPRRSLNPSSIDSEIVFCEKDVFFFSFFKVFYNNFFNS